MYSTAGFKSDCVSHVTSLLQARDKHNAVDSCTHASTAISMQGECTLFILNSSSSCGPGSGAAYPSPHHRSLGNESSTMFVCTFPLI